MIVPQPEKTIISSNLNQGTEYKILANAKMMNILSNNIYSNKVRAVMRELSTNAYDSHVMAGKPHLPFDVFLPTTKSPVFKIRDYGVGLSPEDVISLYSTYGSSNKTNSNEFVGFMGLGSKSPFALVSSFTTTSYFNGVKYTFLNFKNEQDIPTITLVSEGETSEKNGLEISFISPKDQVVKFMEEMWVVYLPFDVKPNIYGCPQDSFFTTAQTNQKIALENVSKAEKDGLKFFFTPGTNTYSSASYSNIFHFVKMGNVFYSLPQEYRISSRYLERLTDFYSLKQQLDGIKCVYVEVNVGDIDVSTSREEIQLTKRSAECLGKIFDNFWKQRVLEIERIAASCTDVISKNIALAPLPESLEQSILDLKIFKNPNRTNSIHLDSSLFSSYITYSYMISNVVLQNSNYSNSSGVNKYVHLPGVKIFHNKQNSSSIVSGGRPLLVIRYDARTYQHFLQNKQKTKGILLLLKDEKRYVLKLDDIIHNYRCVILSESKEELKKAEEILLESKFDLISNMKISDIKAPVQDVSTQSTNKTKTKLVKKYDARNLMTLQSEVLEEEVFSKMPDDSVVLYVTYDTKKRNSLIFDPGSIVDFSQVSKDEVFYKLNSWKFEDYQNLFSILLKVDKSKISNKLIFFPEKWGQQCIEKYKKLKFVNIMTEMYKNHDKALKYSAITNFYQTYSLSSLSSKDLEMFKDKFKSSKINLSLMKDDLLFLENLKHLALIRPVLVNYSYKKLVAESEKRNSSEEYKNTMMVLSKYFSDISKINNTLALFKQMYPNFDSNSPEVKQFKQYMLDNIQK